MFANFELKTYCAAEKLAMFLSVKPNESYCWEGFAEKVGFEPGVTDDESGDNDRDELISE